MTKAMIVFNFDTQIGSGSVDKTVHSNKPDCKHRFFASRSIFIILFFTKVHVSHCTSLFPNDPIQVRSLRSNAEHREVLGRALGRQEAPAKGRETDSNGVTCSAIALPEPIQASRGHGGVGQGDGAIRGSRAHFAG
jgi:hypothetical protein